MAGVTPWKIRENQKPRNGAGFRASQHKNRKTKFCGIFNKKEPRRTLPAGLRQNKTPGQISARAAAVKIGKKRLS